MAGRVQFKVTLSGAGESVTKFVIAGGTEKKNIFIFELFFQIEVSYIIYLGVHISSH